MTLTRRTLLRTGAASVLIVVAAGGAWLSTRRSRTAREPWLSADRGLGDLRLDVLAYAILAPNPHNMQPWLVQLDDADGFTLYALTERLLPETDPPARQITIGFGCFLELARQAAAARGYRLLVTPFPDGEPWPSLDDRPVARVTLREDQTVENDPLFATILKRHTQRAPFDTERPVAGAALRRIEAVAGDDVTVAASDDAELRTTLRGLTREAWTTEWSNAATRRESIAVMRIGKAEVSAKPWGLSLNGPLLDTLGAAGMLSREALDDAESAAYRQSLDQYANACDTAMAYLWMSTPSNTRGDQLAAGAAWVRLQQAAIREGVAFHPLSQALQEFPAMAGHYETVHGLLAPDGHTLQMLSRLGYAPDAGPAPREPLTTKLMSV